MTNELYLKIKELKGIAWEIEDGKAIKLPEWKYYFSEDFKELITSFLKKRALRRAKHQQLNNYNYYEYSLGEEKDYYAREILNEVERQAPDWIEEQLARW